MFWKRKRKKSTSGKPPAPLVEVVYRDLSDQRMPTTTPGYGYVYKWAAPQVPQVGLRIMAPVFGRGEVPAVIIRCSPPIPHGYTRSDLSTITRLPTAREVRNSR